MPRSSAPYITGEWAKKVVGVLFGSSKVMLLAIVALVAFDWFADGLRNLVRLLITKSDPAREWLGYLALMLPFPILMFVLLHLTRKAAKEVQPLIHDAATAPQTPALIFFLSPPGDAAAVQFIEDVISGESVLSDAGSRNNMPRSPWRMPLEAMLHHAEGADGRLREVVVIPSEEHLGDADHPPATGTWNYVDLFKQFIMKIAAGGAQFRVRELRELFSAAGGVRPRHKYDRGVDFESAQALVDALNDAFAALRAEGVADRDILIDVTGGQKVPTIAGAVVALAEGRRFQYVSTHDFRVRVYDVTYGT